LISWIRSGSVHCAHSRSGRRGMSTRDGTDDAV
jgi:hypothetical protein